MGNSGRIFKRQCQGEAGNRKGICREPSGVCNQCNRTWGRTAKGAWCKRDRGAYRRHMDWYEIHRGLHAGNFWSAGLSLWPQPYGGAVFWCNRSVERKRQKCGSWKCPCKYDLWNEPGKCLPYFRGFLKSSWHPYLWYDRRRWKGKACP